MRHICSAFRMTPCRSDSQLSLCFFVVSYSLPSSWHQVVSILNEEKRVRIEEIEYDLRESPDTKTKIAA